MLVNIILSAVSCKKRWYFAFISNSYQK